MPGDQCYSSPILLDSSPVCGSVRVSEYRSCDLESRYCSHTTQSVTRDRKLGAHDCAHCGCIAGCCVLRLSYNKQYMLRFRCNYVCTCLALGSYPPATIGPHGSHTRCLGMFTLLKYEILINASHHHCDVEHFI